MDTNDKKKHGRGRQRALTAGLALLTTASVVTGSLFDSPDALLNNGDAPSIVYQMADGAEDDDAGSPEDENDESRRRGGGIRAMLRQRILALPLALRLLVILPLWGLGTALLTAAGALWTVLGPVAGKVALFALLLVLLGGSFALAAKSVFPDLPLKKLASRRSLLTLVLGSAALALADAALTAFYPGYPRVKNLLLSAGFFLVLCCLTVPFALREQRRRLAAAVEKTPPPPKTLTFTDAAGSFTVTIPNLPKG